MRTTSHSKNHRGKERQVGFEIEYAGIDLPAAARLITECWGGEIISEHKDSIIVKNTALGDFTVKLDMEWMRELAKHSKENQANHMPDMEGIIEEINHPLIELYYPNEIVTPPLPISQIDILNDLVEVLRMYGAKGTRCSLTYAFGLHINPDVPSLKAEVLLAYMQAFVLLYEWLEDTMHMDISRQLRLYADNYPPNYAKHILNREYQPDIKQLINDYLTYTPSRNRGLDMLPVFTFIDKERVRSVFDNKRVKKRPTFHFRMPNCEIDDPSWSIEKEWSRWLVLENLAWNHPLRAKMAASYPKHHNDFYEYFTHEWLHRSQSYVEAFA